MTTSYCHIKRWTRLGVVMILGKLRQEELCEFVSSLVYIVSSRTARAIKRDPV